ncbi:MAG: hypothetical protein IPL61_37930 [Myxococcales bacterium]|nr:hypothetical protein [Myxococcales bacterium]
MQRAKATCEGDAQMQREGDVRRRRAKATHNVRRDVRMRRATRRAKATCEGDAQMQRAKATCEGARRRRAKATRRCNARRRRAKATCEGAPPKIADRTSAPAAGVDPTLAYTDEETVF